MTANQHRHLSPHFILYEFAHSGIATDNNLSNDPGLKERKALTALCDNILEPLRQTFGPIIISSGYRSPQVNALAGGVRNSQHVKGEAADIAADSPDTLHRYYNFVKRNLDFDQLILEPNDAHPRWLHVSYTTERKNRHNIVKM